MAREGESPQSWRKKRGENKTFFRDQFLMLPGERTVFFFLRLGGEEFIVKHLAHAPAHPHPQFFFWGAPPQWPCSMGGRGGDRRRQNGRSCETRSWLRRRKGGDGDVAKLELHLSCQSFSFFPSSERRSEIIYFDYSLSPPFSSPPPEIGNSHPLLPSPLPRKERRRLPRGRQIIFGNPIQRATLPLFP